MDDVKNELKMNQRDEDFDRRNNENCFLKDKQRIKYNSFIFLEIIPLEKQNQLFNGLDNLYSEVNGYCSTRLEYREIYSNRHHKLFQKCSLNLPSIVNLNCKENYFDTATYQDLGDNIREIEISVSNPLPSIILLQLNVHLNEEVSQKINEIVYKYHPQKEETITLQNGTFIKKSHPEMQKRSEISNFRNSLHKETIDFLKKYFSGIFFYLAETAPSIVPTIDVISFDYPSDEKGIIAWGRENSGFISCFNTYFSSHTCYRNRNYLLMFESNDFEDNNYNNYSNYIVFANRKERIDKSYFDIDSEIVMKINECDFNLIAIDRFVREQENQVGKLNTLITQEIENLQSDNLNKIIDNQKKVVKAIFSFERFSIEFSEPWSFHRNFKFKNLIFWEDVDKSTELFHEIKDSIDFRIKKINILNSLFSQEYEKILSLKNLEYNKKMQQSVYYLTIIVIFLAFIQLLLLLKTELWNLIMTSWDALLESIYFLQFQ